MVSWAISHFPKKGLFGESTLSKTLDSECVQSYGAALFGGILGGTAFVDFAVEGVTGPAAEEVSALQGLRFALRVCTLL
jgi:hypothetical protein